MAKIIVNGEAHEYTRPLNIKELITQALVESPEMVSVQLNEEFVEREVWALTQLQDGDQVDFLYFMGGGQKD